MDGTGSLQFGWQDPNDRPLWPRNSNPFVLHVYGIIGKGRRSKLIFVPPTPPLGSKLKKSKETYTAKHFIGILPDIKAQFDAWKLDGGRYRLILDNAKQHTAKAAKAALQQSEIKLMDDFPAQSWDINVIENVWGVMESKLRAQKGPYPRTPDGWRTRLERVWADVSIDTINKLVGCVKERMAAIVEKEGAWLSKHK